MLSTQDGANKLWWAFTFWLYFDTFQNSQSWRVAKYIHFLGCAIPSHTKQLFVIKAGDLSCAGVRAPWGERGAEEKKNLWCELAGEDWFYWDFKKTAGNPYREGTQRDHCQMFKWDTVSVWVSWHKSRGLRATWALWRLDQSLCAALCRVPFGLPIFTCPASCGSH